MEIQTPRKRVQNESGPGGKLNGRDQDLLNLGSGLKPSLDALGIPLVVREDLDPEGTDEFSYAVPYGQRVRTAEEPEGGFVHFFLDDYRFAGAWTRPGRALRYIQPYGSSLTPDFSLYPEMPLALQIFQVYRNRWCGAFWQQEAGITVIPTVGWSDEESFAFCFLGIEEGSAVALSTVGLQRGATEEERAMFVSGYEEMVRQIDPSLILVHGETPEKLLSGLSEEARAVPRKAYPSHWRSIKNEKKRLAEARTQDTAGETEGGQNGRFEKHTLQYPAK